MSFWHRTAHFLLRPTYSFAELFGLMALLSFEPWWLAIPLMFVWMFACSWAAEKVAR